MGCPKLTYHLFTEPRMRCVYNAADGETNCAVYQNNGNNKTGLGDYSYHNNSWYEVWANQLGGVPESDWNPRNLRRKKWWYWTFLLGLPSFPH